MEFFCEGRCAVMTILQKDMRETGATEDDLDGLPPYPDRSKAFWRAYA